MSHAKNGLKTGSATPNNGIMILSLPPESITAVKSAGQGAPTGTHPRAATIPGLNLEQGRIVSTNGGSLERFAGIC